MQDGLHAHSLLILKVQDDLGLGVIDDALAIFAVLQRKEVVQVLCGADGGAAISADDLEDLQHELCRKAVGRRADELQVSSMKIEIAEIVVWIIHAVLMAAAVYSLKMLV